MESTKYKIFIIEDKKILDKNLTISLDYIKSYNIYNYNSRKAFMLRITLLNNKNKFYLIPEMDKKNMMEQFFKTCSKRHLISDTYLKLYPILLCVVYIIFSLIFITL